MKEEMSVYLVRMLEEIKRCESQSATTGPEGVNGIADAARGSRPNTRPVWDILFHSHKNEDHLSSVPGTGSEEGATSSGSNRMAINADPQPGCSKVTSEPQNDSCPEILEMEKIVKAIIYPGLRDMHIPNCMIRNIFLKVQEKKFPSTLGRKGFQFSNMWVRNFLKRNFEAEYYRFKRGRVAFHVVILVIPENDPKFNNFEKMLMYAVATKDGFLSKFTVYKEECLILRDDTIDDIYEIEDDEFDTEVEDDNYDIRNISANDSGINLDLSGISTMSMSPSSNNNGIADFSFDSGQHSEELGSVSDQDSEQNSERDSEREDSEKASEEDSEKASEEEDSEKASEEEDSEKASEEDSEKASEEEDSEKASEEEDSEKASEEKDSEKASEEEDSEKASEDDDMEIDSEEEDSEKDLEEEGNENASEDEDMEVDSEEEDLEEEDSDKDLEEEDSDKELE